MSGCVFQSRTVCWVVFPAEGCGGGDDDADDISPGEGELTTAHDDRTVLDKVKNNNDDDHNDL